MGKGSASWEEDWELRTPAGGSLLSSARTYTRQLLCPLSRVTSQVSKGEEMTGAAVVGPRFLLPAWDAHPYLIPWATATHASRLRCQWGVLAQTCNPVLVRLTQKDQMFQVGLGLHKKTQVLLSLSASTSAPSRWHPHLQWIKNLNGFACGSASLLLTVFSYVRNHTLTYFFSFLFGDSGDQSQGLTYSR